MSVNTDILKLNVTQQSILKKPEDLQVGKLLVDESAQLSSCVAKNFL